jgi:hypothetical protein
MPDSAFSRESSELGPRKHCLVVGQSIATFSGEVVNLRSAKHGHCREVRSFRASFRNHQKVLCRAIVVLFRGQSLGILKWTRSPASRAAIGK